ncbi:hypothetical protein F5Y01DRAFT_152359 [Xylaria sp. FL0043]|nr:hypothetical protein F5Y01DRAFT_152359 [Xylaria sp. FL0043]
MPVQAVCDLLPNLHAIPYLPIPTPPRAGQGRISVSLYLLYLCVCVCVCVCVCACACVSMSGSASVSARRVDFDGIDSAMRFTMSYVLYQMHFVYSAFFPFPFPSLRIPTHMLRATTVRPSRLPPASE